MARYFNTEGSCNPKEHYMVRLDDRLAYMKKMLVDRKKYFVINRGRQYGKTTTLKALKEYLKGDYIVLSMDFQKMSNTSFADEQTFVVRFVRQIEKLLSKEKALLKDIEEKDFEDLVSLKDKDNVSVDILFERLSGICETSRRPIVLMIDEADSASNNQVFIDFLAQLRGYYLERDDTPIFYSVILAGVYNIKNLKLKLHPESEHQYNSPWNIAVDFDVEMSFSTDQIAFMLEEYEADCHTGMDVRAVSEVIYEYTSGYPVLVSSICKRIDEKILGSSFEEPETAWSKRGIEKAIKMILLDNAPLFQSMIRHLDEFSEMKRMFHAILFQGSEFAYNPDTKEINLACMFGYAVNREGKVQIANLSLLKPMDVNFFCCT